MPITTLVNNSVDTSVERDTRLTGLASIAVTRDIRSTGQLTTNVVRDARLSASVSPIAYSGPFVSVGDTTSSNSFGFNVPFVNAGSHVILAITHASGGNVTGATDTRGNTWTVDQPSTYTSTTGIAVVSAPILNSIQANDTITITWSAPVTHKAVVGEVFRGLLQATYVDRTASNTGTGYLIDTGTTAQTNFSKELVFGAFAVPGSADVDFAPDVGFTEIGEANSDFGNGANRTVTGAFKIVQAQGAYNVTGSLSPPIATSVIRDIRTIGSAGNNLANL